MGKVPVRLSIMKKQFFILLVVCLLLVTTWANAEKQDWSTPYHMAVLMSAEAVTEFGDDPAQYEGAEFPLFCGIASVYPQENRFVFTKTTDLPISGVEAALRQVERDRYVSPRPPLQMRADRGDFGQFFWGLVNSKKATIYVIYYGWDIPVDVVPRLTRTCRYTTAKEPPTDCAYSVRDLYDVFIPFTEAEKVQITRDAASANKAFHDAPLHLAVIMSAEAVKRSGDDPAKYEGVEFPVYCGIASIYPKKNRFVFTKMTDLPILGVERFLRQVERDGYLAVDASSHYPAYQVQPGEQDFFSLFLSLALDKDFKAYRVSHAQEIPVDYAPQFTQTCRYSAAKTPPTDCAYESWDLEDVYIPLAYEEVRATIERSE